MDEYDRESKSFSECNGESGTDETPSIAPKDVANFLLEQKFYLSALEYYFEQVERGLVIPELHAFFANPSFMENVLPRKESDSYNTARCQSFSTLDSVDIGPNSEEGNASEEKIKVLEYELRKKNEEIEQLRKELTSISIVRRTPVETKSISKSSEYVPPENDSQQPFETRALAVLVHDHLLKLGCRFTAVQFAEEAQSIGMEDVEAWEQVGINLPKPPGLLHLLRSYWSGGRSSTPMPRRSTDPNNPGVERGPENPFDEDLGSEQDEEAGVTDASEVQARLEEIASLQAHVIMLETKNTQLATQAQELRNQLICLEREHAEVVGRPRQGQSDPGVTSPELSHVSASSNALVSLDSRSTSAEFLDLMTNIHPTGQSSNADKFHLASSLEDFVMVVSDALEATLPNLNDDLKVTYLPLLTQAICLHPDPIVRDRLLHLLFNLFSTPLADSPHSSFPGDHTIDGMSTPASPNEIMARQHRHRMIILNECRRLASYMGPTRIESELISQLWSQLNQRPRPPDAQRLLIVSACGVILPNVPVPLRSSLMLSILESNLDEEFNDSVRAASIRSLACLVTLISDWDKLPQLVQRLNSLLADVDSCRSAVDWLLPAVAEWCLELDNLHTALIDSWLDHLDGYILSAHSSSEHVTYTMVIRALSILTHLVPFLHAWILITLVKPADPEQTYWNAANTWVMTQHKDQLSSKEATLLDDPVSLDAGSITDPRIILGHDAFRSLRTLMQDRLNTDDDEGTHWTARSWLHNILLPKLVDMLSAIPRQQASSKASSGLIYDHNKSLEAFVSRQFDQHFAYPWSQKVDADSTALCMAVCHLLHTLGSNLGELAMDKLLTPPFHDALMKKTELGNFEYDHQAMQTSLLAAYCVLLASVKAKSQSAKVRMLLTNAVFLQVRESYPLDSIRLAIWCLCLHGDTEYAILEIILPALRPCVSCADCVVRRASATLLHTMIECLRAQPQWPNQLLEPIYQLINQLGRDDLTGQRQFIHPDEADWSVLAVSLGPLYGLLQLLHCLGPRPSGEGRLVGETVEGHVDREGPDLVEQLYDLLRLQFDLVLGPMDPGASGDSSPPMDTETPEIARHHFWPILTVALLTLTDRLLPSCSNVFRDTVLLPWLCRLAELSNSLPNLDQRARLADQLFAVFSTASYSVQLEESLFRWLVPGLGRVRLDLTEAGDTVRIHEVEQFLNDLYARIRSSEGGTDPSQSKEPSRRSAMTTLARLAMRTSAQSPTQSEHKQRRQTRTPRLNLKKR